MIKKIRQYRITPLNDDGLPMLALDDHNDDGLPMIKTPSKKKEETFPLIYKREKKDSLSANLRSPSTGQSDSIELTKLTTDPEAEKRYQEHKAKFEQFGAKEPDADDPIGGILSPVRKGASEMVQSYLKGIEKGRSESTSQQALSPVTKREIESQNENLVDENALAKYEVFKDRVERQIIPEAETATFNLVEYGKNKGIDIAIDEQGIAQLTPEIIEKLPKNNETIQALINRVKEYNDITDDFTKSGGRVADAAVLSYLKKNPFFGEQLTSIQDAKGSNAFEYTIPPVLRGKMISEYLSDPNVKLAASKDEYSQAEYDNLSQNLLTIIPEYGATIVGNEMSRAIEEAGKNNWLVNVNWAKGRKEAINEIANKLYADDPQKLKIFNDIVSADLGKYIHTPGLLERSVSGLGHWASGTVNSLEQLVGLKSEGENIYETLKKQSEATYSDPKGILHQATSIGGDMGGLIVGTILGSKGLSGAGLSPQLANTISIVTTFYGDEKERADAEYPGEPNKQTLKAGLMTALYANANHLLPTKQLSAAMTKARPEIDNIVQQLSDGVISREAAKDATNNIFKSILEGAVETGKKSARAGLENAAIVEASNLTDKILGMDAGQFAQSHPDNELVEAAKMGVLGTIIPSAIAVRGNKNVAKNSIYDIASSPERSKRLIEEQALLNPESAQSATIQKEMVDYLADVKKTLDQEGIDIKRQKTYLLQSAAEQAIQRKIDATNEPVLQKKYKEELKKSQEIKEGILAGIPEEQIKTTEQVEGEADRNKLIEKGHKAIDKLLEQKDENDKPIFTGIYRDVAKSDPLGFLKEVAEQAQGVTSTGKEAKGGGREIDMIPKYGADLINVAKELFPKNKLIQNEPTTKSDADVGEISGGQKTGQEGRSDGGKPERPETRQEGGEENIVTPEKEKRIAVIRPEEVKQTETITIKPKKDAVSEQVTDEVDVRQQTTDGKGMGERDTKPEVNTGKEEKGKTEGEEEIRLSHADTKKIYQEHGLPERLETPNKKDTDLIEAADKLVKEGYNFDKEAEKVMSGEKSSFTDEEQVAFAKAVGALKAKQEGMDINNPEFDALQNKIEKYSRASDVVGTLEGRAFRARRLFQPKEEGIADFVMREKEVSKTDILTEKEKKTVQKEFKDISEAEKKYEDKIKLLEEENSRLLAEQGYKAYRKTTPKKKSKEDFISERKSLREELKAAREEHQKWLKDQGIQQAGIGISFTGKEAKIIAKYLKSYADEGIQNFKEAVKKVLDEVKDIFPGISEKDIIDIAAGVYNEKKPTRSELAVKLRDWKTEAELINKLEKLEKGEKPKSERKKRELNRQITQLKEKIKPYTDIAASKKRYEEGIKELEYKLKTGDFDKEGAPKKELKLDEEALRLKDRKIQLQKQREIRLAEKEFRDRPIGKKIADIALTPFREIRTIKSSFDYSAPLRQGIIPTIFEVLTNPKQAAIRWGRMAKSSANEKFFDRFMYDLKNSSDGHLMEKSGVDLADPNNFTKKEEVFQSRLVQKIPYVGTYGIKGSERAFAYYLNSQRADLFMRGVDLMTKKGMTFQNSEKAYKDWGSIVNTLTGRGELSGVFKDASGLLTLGFFSPRLMASRLSFFNPLFYAKIPKPLRLYMAKQMLSFIGVGSTIVGLAVLAGAEGEIDPRSADFGKIKIGNTRLDIWGGFQQYIRLFSSLATMSRKTQGGEIKSLLERDRGGELGVGKTIFTFARSKASPIVGSAVDLTIGENVIGEKATPKSEAIDFITPLLWSDMYEAAHEEGGVGILKTLPAIFGVGVQTYEPRSSEPQNDGGNNRKIKIETRKTRQRETR